MTAHSNFQLAASEYKYKVYPLNNLQLKGERGDRGFSYEKLKSLRLRI